MDPLPVSAAAFAQPRTIRSLEPNVAEAEALVAFERRASLLRGRLRRIAQAYLPFTMYEVAMSNRGVTRQTFFAADAYSGTLDLFQFDAPPAAAQLATVQTRNCPDGRLPPQRAVELLEAKVRRVIYQSGFFRVRALEIRSRALPLGFHVPYWLGFFGNGQRASLQVMDAVRRRFEGAKARAVFNEWLLDAE